MVMQDV